MKAEVLLAAKRRGIDSDRIVFSDRLQWTDRDGDLALSFARVNSGRVTIFLNAIKSRDVDYRYVIEEVAKVCDEDGLVFEKSGFNEDEPRDDQGRWTDGGGDSGDDSGSGSTGGSAADSSGAGSSGGPAVSSAAPEGSSGAYERTSPRNDQGSGRLSGASIVQDFAPTKSHAESLAARDATPLTFHELGKGGGAVFRSAIDSAKAGSKFGSAVTLYDVGNYDKARTFLTSDGLSGFALKGNDIISVFKDPSSSSKQTVASILALAVQEGGKRLDCFDTVLPNIYAHEGFKAVSRTPFDDQFQPPGWDKSLFKAFNGGSPDVVFMIYDPTGVAYKAGDGKMFDSYDEAQAAQIAALPSSTPAADLLSSHHNDETHTLAEMKSQLSPAFIAEAEKAQNEMKGLPLTNVKYTGPDGKYVQARASAQSAILRDLFSQKAISAATPKAGEKPTLILTGGRPAAGKTSSLAGELGDKVKSSFYISADEIQEHLPGYMGRHAGLFNGEAQDIALQAEKIARHLGLNILYDATMKTKQSALDRVQNYKAAGYDVDGYFVHTTPTTSALRSADRFMHDPNGKGRYIPPEASFNSRSNEATFDSLIPHLRNWALYDNNGDKPVRIAGSLK